MRSSFSRLEALLQLFREDTEFLVRSAHMRGMFVSCGGQHHET